MEAATIQTKEGNIHISRIAIETLVYMTLQEIKSVVEFQKNIFRNITDKLIKGTGEPGEKVSQEIKIEIKPNEVVIDLFLVIHYGIRIPDLTWEIQAKIKEKLKEVAGLEINKINIHIQGIRYPRKYRNKSQLLTPEIFVKVF